MTDWLLADWPAPRGVLAGTTLRRGGVSGGPYESLNLGMHVDDSPGDVIENRRRFRHMCRLPADPQWLQQVHGTAVAEMPNAREHPEADAAVTTQPGVVCAVLTADCLPVLFARKDGSAVAAAHAGWRGLLAGVLESTVAALGSPGELMAWFGPAISQPAFEVGEEVREAFVSHDSAASACFVPNNHGRWQADLYQLARQRLQYHGVTSLHGGGRCTFAERDAFFSYRRDGQCGRMASFVVRTP